MDRDYYLLKEIFLGLRNEYKFYQYDLDRLKNYSQIINEDKVNEYYFKIIGDKPELYCYIDSKKNIIKKLIDDIKIKLDIYDYEKDDYKAHHNCEGMYFTDGKVIISGGERFNDKLTSILTSPFTNNIACNIDGVDKQDSISFDRLEINYCYFLENAHYGFIQYHPTNTSEQIVFLNNFESFDEKKIHDILNTKYPKKSFSPYHQQLIESYRLASKPLEFEDLPTINKGNITFETMELEETPYEFILKHK